MIIASTDQLHPVNCGVLQGREGEREGVENYTRPLLVATY